MILSLHLHLESPDSFALRAMMPVIYKIDTVLGLVFYKGFDANMAEMFLSEMEAAADPLRLPNTKILIDISETKLDISLADINEAINLNRQPMRDGQPAFLYGPGLEL